MHLRNTHVCLALLIIPVLSCKPDNPDPGALQSIGVYASDTAEVITVSRDQFIAAGMKTGGLQPYSFAETIHANGYLDVPPQNRVRISTLMGGFVKHAGLLPGDYVRQGQTLALLENREYLKLQQDYLESKEQLAYLKTVYENQKTLAGERIAAQRSYMEARSDYNRMLATCESLAKQLQLIHMDTSSISAGTMVSEISLVAPINGFLTSVNAVNGMFANPSDMLFEIIDPSRMHLELRVFEKDVLQLKKGQAITFRIPDASREAYSGKVILIGKAIEGDARTVAVHGQVTDKKASHLLPGMYVEASIHANPGQIMGLPAEALITEEGSHFVLVQKAARDSNFLFEKIPVEVGAIHDTWFEVHDTAGIFHQTGGKILIKGSYFLTRE